MTTSPPLPSVTPADSSGSPSPTSSRFDLNADHRTYSQVAFASTSEGGNNNHGGSSTSPPNERSQLLSPGRQIPKYWSDGEDSHASSGPHLPRGLGSLTQRSPSKPKAVMVQPYRSRERE
jgi:hypothetical protein